MKRDELVAGTDYVKAGNNYGQPWASAHRVTVLDTGRWWNETGYWGHRHYGAEKVYVLEDGTTFRKPSCCFGKGTSKTATNGVLIRTDSGSIKVINPGQLRDTWENHKRREAEAKLRRAQNIEQRKIRDAEWAKQRAEMEALASQHGIDGIINSGSEWNVKPPTITFTAAQFKTLVTRLKGE